MVLIPETTGLLTRGQCFILMEVFLELIVINPTPHLVACHRFLSS